jgi:hypothetical protein
MQTNNHEYTGVITRVDADWICGDMVNDHTKKQAAFMLPNDSNLFAGADYAKLGDFIFIKHSEEDTHIGIVDRVLH